MLQSLHSSASSFFIKILFGLLVASFALWGIGDMFRSSGSTTVVKVGDTTVGAQEFNGELQRALQEYRAMLGKEYSNELALNLGVPQMVLARLVEQKLVEQEAKALGLIISDNILVDVLRQTPAFKNAKGVFDAQLFRNVLQQNGLSEKQYMELLRKEIAADMLMQTTLSGVTVPDVAAQQAYLAEHETRIIDMLVLRRELARVDAPSDEEVQTFYQQNQPLYQEPEKRKFSLLLIDSTKIAASEAPADEELKALFETRKEEFSTPEKRRVSQLLYTSQENAQNAYDLLKQGRDFDEASKEVAPINSDFSLGEVTFEQLAAEVAQDVFLLSENTYSEPLQTRFGWHVFFVHSIIPAKEATFADAKEKLLEEWRMNRAAELTHQLSNEVHDSLASGLSFEDIASRYQAQVQHIGPVTAGDASLPENPAALREHAFNLAAGETAPLMEGENGILYALRVAEVILAVAKPFAEVRGQVVADWKKEQQLEKLKALSAEVAKKVKDSSLAEAAKTFGADYLAKQPVKRDTGKIGNTEVSAPFMAMVFTLRPDSFSEPVPLLGEKYALVQVKDVQHPSLDTDTAQQGVENARLNLRNVYIDEYYKQYMQYLMSKHAVSEPNMALINAMMQ